MKNMNKKYFVESRRIASKMLGMPGYLFLLDLLAVIRMIRNERRSTMSLECEARQNAQVKRRTEKNR